MIITADLTSLYTERRPGLTGSRPHDAKVRRGQSGDSVPTLSHRRYGPTLSGTAGRRFLNYHQMFTAPPRRHQRRPSAAVRSRRALPFGEIGRVVEAARCSDWSAWDFWDDCRCIPAASELSCWAARNEVSDFIGLGTVWEIGWDLQMVIKHCVVPSTRIQLNSNLNSTRLMDLADIIRRGIQRTPPKRPNISSPSLILYIKPRAGIKII